MTPPEAQMPGPLSLQDILYTMKQGFSRVESRFDEVKGDLHKEVGKLRREQGETKDIATKALTTADTTKKEMKELTRRVAALEKGEVPKAPGTTATRTAHKQLATTALAASKEMRRFWDPLTNTLPGRNEGTIGSESEKPCLRTLMQ